MIPVTIPYHLMILGILSLIILSVIIKKRRSLFKRYKWFWISATVFLSIYTLIVLYSSYLLMYYRWNLNQFDLDGNGIFSGIEVTSEQQMALIKCSSDTALNYSFITGLLLALGIALLTFLFGFIVERLNKAFN